MMFAFQDQESMIQTLLSEISTKDKEISSLEDEVCVLLRVGDIESSNFSEQVENLQHSQSLCTLREAELEETVLQCRVWTRLSMDGVWLWISKERWFCLGGD